MAQNPTRIETTTKTVIKQTEAFLLASTRIWDSAHELVPIDGANAGKHKDGNDVDTYADLPFREDASGTGVTQEYVDNEILAVNQGWNDGDSLLFNDYTAKLALKGSGKFYIVNLSQSGTSAPTGVVIINQLVGTPTFARDDVGSYTINLAGAFLAAKTGMVCLPCSDDSTAVLGMKRIDDDTIGVYQTAPTDGSPVDGLTNRTVWIVVGP